MSDREARKCSTCAWSLTCEVPRRVYRSFVEAHNLRCDDYEERGY